MRGYPRQERVEDAENVALLQLDGPLPEGSEALPLGGSAGAAGHDFQTFGFIRARMRGFTERGGGSIRPAF